MDLDDNSALFEVLGEQRTPATSSAEGTDQPATVVAFDLGTCRSGPAYRRVVWYFPEHGESLDLARAPATRARREPDWRLQASG